MGTAIRLKRVFSDGFLKSKDGRGKKVKAGRGGVYMAI